MKKPSAPAPRLHSPKAPKEKKIAKFDFDWTKEYLKSHNAHSADWVEKQAIKKKLNEIIERINNEN